MPESACLLGQRSHEMRMRMAQRIHGNAGTKIEISLAGVGDKIGSLTPLKSNIETRISGQYRRNHFQTP